MKTNPLAFRPLYAWSALIVITVAYILSNIDRQIISVLIQPIQRDMGINDTEFGSLQGIAYGLAYAAFCIPIASLADRFSRSLVISVGLGLWSAATFACGLVTTFEQLFIARIIVGIGESSLLPAAYSLFGDIFPKEKLGRAMGVYSLGPFLGSSLAFLLGGAAFQTLGEAGQHELFGHVFHTWQLTFIAAAVPGLLLAIVIKGLIRDPRAQAVPSVASAKPAAVPFSEVLRYLWTERAVFRPQLIGFPLLALTLYATLGWSPAYLSRTAGLTPGEAGLWLGSVALIAGGSGALLAGILTDALVSRKRGAGSFEVGMIAAFFIGATALWVLLSGHARGPFVLVSIGILFGSFSMAPAVAVIQSVAPSTYRSRISGIFLLINILGQTLGNFIVGFLNDQFFGGPLGIKSSLPILLVLATTGSIIMLASGRKALSAAILGQEGR